MDRWGGRASVESVLSIPAWETRLEPHYRGASISLISKEVLIKSKLAAGRRVDLADVAALRGVGGSGKPT